jgi:hypothetical protein
MRCDESAVDRALSVGGRAILVARTLRGVGAPEAVLDAILGIVYRCLDVAEGSSVSVATRRDDALRDCEERLSSLEAEYINGAQCQPSEATDHISGETALGSDGPRPHQMLMEAVEKLATLHRRFPSSAPDRHGHRRERLELIAEVRLLTLVVEAQTAHMISAAVLGTGAPVDRGSNAGEVTS